MPNEALIAEALQLSQHFEVSVFPVAADKRPIVKWRKGASRDPEKIREMFAQSGAAGIGVPCGPDNNLLVVDIDYGHTEDQDRLNKLHSWAAYWRDYADCSAVIRKTPSGGEHWIFEYPDEGVTIPRNIMPYIDVIYDGFYFVYSMADHDGYSHVSEPQDDMLDPPLGMLDVVERRQGGNGASLPTSEEAHEIMQSDGDKGQRHLALLRMTQDWADDHQDLDLRELCRGFVRWFTDIYGECIVDDARWEALTEWRVDRETGEAAGELGRAMAGAYESPSKSLAQLGAALRERGPRTPLIKVAKVQEVKKLAGPPVGLEWLSEDLPPPDWLIPGVLERRKILGVAGVSNAGKTRWVMLVAAALSAGQPQRAGLGLEAADPMAVMLVANEESELDLKRRLKATSEANGLEMQKPIVFCGQGWFEGKPHTHLLAPDPKDRTHMIPNTKLIDTLVERALVNEVEVIVLDPYVTLGLQTENAASENNELFAIMRQIADRTGAAIMFVHHSGRGESRTESPDAVRGLQAAFRGSSVITSSMDVGFSLLPYRIPEVSKAKDKRIEIEDKIKSGKCPNYVVLDWVKSREGRMGGAVCYEIKSHPMVGGYDIGVMVPVEESVAKLEQQRLLMGFSDPVAAAASEVARVIGEAFRDGDKLTIAGMHKVLQGRVKGWPDQRTPPRKDNKLLVALTSALCKVPYDIAGGCTVLLVSEEDHWTVRINQQE